MTLWIAFTYIITTVIVGLFSPFWGLIGLIGSQLIRFQDRFPVINSIPTFLIMSAAVLLGFYINRYKLGTAYYWPDKYFKRFLGWACIGLLVMEFTSFIEPVKFVISSMLMYYMASRSFTTPNKFLILFFFLTIISALMGYEASHAFLTEEVTNFAYSPSPEERRLQGLGRYANPNEFGMLMVIPLTFLFSLIMLSRSFVMRIFYLGLLGFLLFVTALTFSRTCMVLAGIMGLTIAGLWGKGNIVKKAIVMGILGVGLLFILTLIPGPVQERILTILNYEQDASFQGRVRAWQQGFLMIKYNPIFGVGMGQWHQYHGLEAHNSFVTVMSETGLLGIFFYLSAIFYSFKTCLRVIAIPEEDPRYNRKTRVIAISLTATLFGYCVYIFFGNQAYTPLIYLYCGLCAAISNLTNIKPEDVAEENATQNTRAGKRKQRSKFYGQDLLEQEAAPIDQAPLQTKQTNKGTAKASQSPSHQIDQSISESQNKGITVVTSTNTDTTAMEAKGKSKKRFPQAP